MQFISAFPSVVLSTRDVLIVNKPCGLPFHQGDAGPGVMQVLRWQQAQGQLGYDGPLFPVHRSVAATRRRRSCAALARSQYPICVPNT